MSPSWPDNRFLPEFNMNEIRDVIFDWLDLLVEHHGTPPAEGNPDQRDERLKRIAAVAADLKFAADKSSYLARRFSGEIHRTQPCPEHRGRWSGLGFCDYGCDLTGWLPRVEPKAPEEPQ